MGAILSAFGNNPVGAAGGSLSGSFPNPGLAVTGTNFSPVTFGTTNSSTAQTANLLNYYVIEILTAVTLTGVIVENGATATGNILVALYNAAGSSLLASSASTAQSGTFAGQFIPFSSTFAAPAGPYILAVMYSSSSATAASAVMMSPSKTAAQGSFTLPATVTVPTATGNTQPLAFTGTY